MNIKVRIFSQRSPNCPLYEEQNDCLAEEEKSHGGGGDLITKGLKEVGEEESERHRALQCGYQATSLSFLLPWLQ